MNKEKIKIALAIFGVAAIVTTVALALNVIVYYDTITKGEFEYVLCELFGNGYNRSDYSTSNLLIPMLIFDILSAFLWFACVFNFLKAIPVKQGEDAKGE